jgi:hypothetical protein
MKTLLLLLLLQTQAEKLLDESYAASRQMKDHDDRANFLADHCEASVRIRPPARATKYCAEAFAFAKAVRVCQERQRIQMKILVALSDVDPQLAFTLFKQVPACRP